jgi:multicomponent Na+:H+ antiporter subunit B
MEVIVNAVLLTLLVIITIAVARQRNLFGVVMLAGTYSFLMASILIALDAVDVAMTEAAVGAGVSTVILLATLHLTRSREYPKPRSAVVPLFVTAVTGAALVWGTLPLPPFGAADTPMHRNTSPRYMEDAKAGRIAPNVVTAVLADYRGYDTLGETTVIFTAGIGIVMLLRTRRRKDGKGDAP